MASRFPEEFKAVTDLRIANPQMPAKTLARKIKNGEAGYVGAANRTFLSTYSVIRRYDAKQRLAQAQIDAAFKAVKTTKAVKKAGKRIAESVA
jgi:hypothetical protein